MAWEGEEFSWSESWKWMPEGRPGEWAAGGQCGGSKLAALPLQMLQVCVRVCGREETRCPTPEWPELLSPESPAAALSTCVPQG